MKDAWKLLDDLYRKYTREWLVRHDLRVRALATERCVELGLGDQVEGKFGPTWKFKTTQRNVSTMRELALTLWAACDFVERANPTWSSHSVELDPVESFEVKR